MQDEHTKGRNYMTRSLELLQPLVEQIKEESEPLNAINKLADLVMLTHRQQLSIMEEIRVMVLKNAVAIFGNGNPDDCLKVRVSNLEKTSARLLAGISVLTVAIASWLSASILNLV